MSFNFYFENDAAMFRSVVPHLAVDDEEQLHFCSVITKQNI